MRILSTTPSFTISSFRKIKNILILTCMMSISFMKSYGQCYSAYDMVVGSSVGCDEATLSVYEYYGNASYFKWYKKSSSGSWQYLGQVDAVYGQTSYYTVSITATTTFGVSYYDSYNWCESPKRETTISPTAPPTVSGSGTSCEPGTVIIQAQVRTIFPPIISMNMQVVIIRLLQTAQEVLRLMILNPLPLMITMLEQNQLQGAIVVTPV